MPINLGTIFNILLIVFALYTLKSVWKEGATPQNGSYPLNKIPLSNEEEIQFDLPCPDAIPLGIKIKEVWDHNPDGPSKATSEEFYFNPNNTYQYYDHQYWLDNEVHCGK